VLLVLTLAGVFVFGLSGGLAGVQARARRLRRGGARGRRRLAGGITRDVLIGVPPQAFRDWRTMAVAGAAGLVTFLAHRIVHRLQRPILVLDAAGLALFCVTGARIALDHGVGSFEAVILGAITGIGGGVLRDILVRQIPVVLREGLYAIPAVLGATIAVVGRHDPGVAVAGAVCCFVLRLAGVVFGLNAPRAAREA
jgi:uncharacterized membrane protein YeiH